MFRPQRTTVLLVFPADPVETPDARLLALDCHSPPTLVSQSISLPLAVAWLASELRVQDQTGIPIEVCRPQLRAWATMVDSSRDQCWQREGRGWSQLRVLDRGSGVLYSESRA